MERLTLFREAEAGQVDNIILQNGELKQQINRLRHRSLTMLFKVVKVNYPEEPKPTTQFI